MEKCTTELKNLRRTIRHLHPLFHQFLEPHTTEYMQLFLSFGSEDQVDILTWSGLPTGIDMPVFANEDNAERLAMHKRGYINLSLWAKSGSRTKWLLNRGYHNAMS